MPQTLTAVEERIDVVVREVETARVRVSKRVVETEQSVDVDLRHQRIDVERVQVNRLVDQRDEPRREGDVFIVPVYEEVLVRRWLLKEELRVTHHSTVEQRRVGPELLRREEISITRTPIASPADAIDTRASPPSCPHQE